MGIFVTMSSALVEGDEFASVGTPDVFAQGAEEAVVAQLFEDVRRPSAGAGDGKDGGEQIGGDAQGVVNCGRVEIDVGVEVFLFFHDLGNALGHLNPFWLAQLFAQFGGHGLEVRRGRQNAQQIRFLFFISLDPK